MRCARRLPRFHHPSVSSSRALPVSLIFSRGSKSQDQTQRWRAHWRQFTNWDVSSSKHISGFDREAIFVIKFANNVCQLLWRFGSCLSIGWWELHYRSLHRSARICSCELFENDRRAHSGWHWDRGSCFATWNVRLESTGAHWTKQIDNIKLVCANLWHPRARGSGFDPTVRKEECESISQKQLKIK